MKNQQTTQGRQGKPLISLKGLVCAISAISILFASGANAAGLGRPSTPFNLNDGIFRFSKRGWGRNGMALLSRDNQHQDALHVTSLLLGDRLRGGSKEVKEKKKSKKNKDADDKEWDELVEAEAIKEDDSTEVKDDAKDEEEEEEEIEEDTEDEYDAEEEEDEEEEASSLGSEMEESSEYDEPLVASPMLQLYATFGVMMLSKRLDLYNPTIVRLARFAFIGYLVILQAFLLYVRFRAKAINDRTPVTVSNPLTNLVQQQLQGPDDSNAMIKNLASSFLSSESTVLEYDLKQSKSMQGGLLFNMALMWLLHFKMEQVQPLMINTVTGLMNMGYSPLFQVYVLGRNLERPFKSPASAMQNMAAGAAEAAAEDAAETETDETTIDDEEDELESAESEDDAEEGAEVEDSDADEDEDGSDDED